MTVESQARVREPAAEKVRPVVALTIAGSDSSSGAGIQADLKTFTALGVYGVTAITCVVAERPGRVSTIEAMSVGIVRDQIEVLAEAFPIAAIKTGLLCRGDIVAAVTAAIKGLWHNSSSSAPLVVDPVMVATSGAQLLEPDAIAAYEANLFPMARLITPNLDEAARLLGRKIAERAAMAEAAHSLSEKYRTAVLLKGGHLSGNDAVDLLCADGQITEFTAPFVPGVSTHGTGCTYSAAITAGLAMGLSLKPAIERAKKFVTESIQTHFAWSDTHALNHFR